MNNTTDPINSIHITSSVYNLKNQLIATGDTTTDIDQLRPGEKTGFEISLSSKVMVVASESLCLQNTKFQIH